MAAAGSRDHGGLRTASALPPKRPRLLDNSAIAVTFFAALEECPVGALDNDRYGIVVRSLERPGWMGGALPRMPGILNEWDQYQHARMTNAGLISFEPHVILRHDVVKAVEPGVAWQPTGVPPCPRLRRRAGGLRQPVASRARDLAIARLFGDPNRPPHRLPDDLLLPEVNYSTVSVYLSGQLRGCQAWRFRGICKPANYTPVIFFFFFFFFKKKKKKFRHRDTLDHDLARWWRRRWTITVSRRTRRARARCGRFR